MQIGDTVNLLRKITQEVWPVTLDEVLIRSGKPAVVVYSRSKRFRYKLDLVGNEVLAIDMKPAHRHDIRCWYVIDETHRKALIELYWDMRRKGR